MKRTNKQIKTIVEEILSLRLVGALPTDIRQHAEKNQWGVKERQLQRYTARADQLLAESLEKNRDKLMSFHFAARRALYARCMSVSDYGTAARILADEAKLLGLYPEPAPAKHTGPPGISIVIAEAVVKIEQTDKLEASPEAAEEVKGALTVVAEKVEKLVDSLYAVSAAPPANGAGEVPAFPVEL